MKKVISGRVYDTSTARKIGVWSKGCTTNMSTYVLEELYQKRTGEFFLYCFGGAFTIYCEREGNITSEGELIRPLTPRAAREWAEENLDGDEYENIFGEVVENMSQIATFIPTTEKEKLDSLRESQKLTIADVLIKGISAFEEELK